MNQQQHVEGQGLIHSVTPEAGAFDGQRPMLIATTQLPKPALAREPWPLPTPNPNTSGPVQPPSPADVPPEPTPLLPFFTSFKRFS